MNDFERLQNLMNRLDQVEDGLRALRDGVDLPAKTPINAALRVAEVLRDRLWQVDKALERECEAAKRVKAPPAAH